MNWRDPKEVAASLVGLPTPDGLEATEYRPVDVQAGNADIDQSRSAIYPPLSPEQMAEGDLTEIRR